MQKDKCLKKTYVEKPNSKKWLNKIYILVAAPWPGGSWTGAGRRTRIRRGKGAGRRTRIRRGKGAERRTRRQRKRPRRRMKRDYAH